MMRILLTVTIATAALGLTACETVQDVFGGSSAPARPAGESAAAPENRFPDMDDARRSVSSDLRGDTANRAHVLAIPPQ